MNALLIIIALLVVVETFYSRHVFLGKIASYLYPRRIMNRRTNPRKVALENQGESQAPPANGHNGNPAKVAPVVPRGVKPSVVAASDTVTGTYQGAPSTFDGGTLHSRHQDYDRVASSMAITEEETPRLPLVIGRPTQVCPDLVSQTGTVNTNTNSSEQLATAGTGSWSSLN
jgi:hypothetical protein